MIRVPAADLRMCEEDRDTERLAKMTPAERLALFLELCDLTDSITAGRPDAARLRAPTPRSTETEATRLGVARRPPADARAGEHRQRSPEQQQRRGGARVHEHEEPAGHEDEHVARRWKK